MARINIEKALPWALKQAEHLQEGECVDLLCKKRNRLVRVVKLKEGFRLEERGFFKEDHRAQDMKELEKALSRLIAREFPRSHMLWAFRRRA
ncbi:MAG: hypothetical protein GXO20_05260 [Thermodesulfobacteria bacterium]|nr:hypothetical protein [Thermodesulfobacteriota bacterium]